MFTIEELYTKRKLGFLFISIVALLCIFNAIMFYQCSHFKSIAKKEVASRQWAEWVMCDCVRNIGESLTLDSVPQGRHFVLRYDATTCLTCLNEAEGLLEDVFGKDYLAKELCGIGECGQVKLLKDYLTIQSDERITPMDDVYTPYFCVINDAGDVLFTLSLIPDNYDYNREILVKLKKALEKS